MTAAGCVWVNGVFSAPEAATVPALDPGVLYGDGLFETLRTYGGRPFRLDAHLARLAAGAQELGFAALPSSSELRERLEDVLRRAALPEALVRVTALRGPSERGAPTLILAALPLPPPRPEASAGLRATLLWRRDAAELPPPWIKSTSYQRTVLARAELSRRGAEEGFFLGEGQTVTEGTVCNVFALLADEDALCTPPARVCLPGVTRAEVLSLARERGLTVREAPLPVGALATAREVFVTSSVSELRPVISLDGRPIGAGQPGPLWRALLDAYRARTTVPS